MQMNAPCCFQGESSVPLNRGIYTLQGQRGAGGGRGRQVQARRRRRRRTRRASGFGNAKSISSSQFNSDEAAGANDYEKQARRVTY